MAAPVPNATAETATTATTAMAPTTAAPSDQAVTEASDREELINRNWKNAQKLRQGIHKELDKIQNGGQDIDAAMAGFTKVEDWLKQYRLFSLEIIMLDIRAANERSVEDFLWQTHTQITKTYRNVTKDLQGPNLAVLKRKVEKLYVAFLVTAQKFYKAYLQRFCGAYKAKELERVARRVRLEDVSGSATVPARTADPETLELITTSFHKTLVYLGDLSRYRTLVRSKDRSFDNALTYYALASEIMPKSGYGYHQSAVIYAEARNHLEIIYYMYRAMACDRPHPLAKHNLEREFRELRQQKGGGGAKAGLDAMVTWFVKLQAFYYQGDEFVGSKELENEVDNRLATTLKGGGEPNVDAILLKMTLINITAFMVKLDSVRADWTDAKSKSCQYILQLNTRTIHTISRILRDELQDILQPQPSQAAASETDISTQQGGKFTPTFHRVLPLFRVYMTWLCFYSADLASYRSHLEPQFGAMCKTLAHTLTLLLELLSNSDNPDTTVSWLFPEDEETIGLECLNGPDLYDGCQLRYDALARKPKPQADEVPSACRSADNAAYIRVFDAVLCGLRLSQHASFPLTLADGSKSFSYVEDVLLPKPGPIPPVVEPQIVANTSVVAAPVVNATAVAAVALSEKPLAVSVPASSMVMNDTEDFSDDGEFYRPIADSARATAYETPAVAASAAPTMAASSEFPIDTQLFKLLNEILDEPDIPATRAGFSQEETDYGMGSRTAAEVFGAVASTSPAPGSASSKTFPTLPWNYFYTSTPTDPALRNQATIRSTGSGWGSRPTSSGSPRAAQGVDSTTDPSRSLSGDQNKQNRLSGGPSTTSPFAYQGPQDWAMQTALASVPRDNHLAQARDARQGWPGVSGDAASHSKRPSNMSLPSPSAPWQQIPPQVSPVGMYHSANSPYPSTLEFSAEDSSLPPVNSPWGVPMAQAQGYMYQGVTPPVGPLRQPAPAFPSYQQPSARSSARSPGFPPGFAGSREFMNGSGTASYNHMPRKSQAAVATEGHSDQSLIDAWANDFGPRSAGSVPGAGFDGVPSQVPALRTDSRVVPVQLPGTEGSIWARGAKPNWNVKSQPK